MQVTGPVRQAFFERATGKVYNQSNPDIILYKLINDKRRVQTNYFFTHGQLIKYYQFIRYDVNNVSRVTIPDDAIITINDGICHSTELIYNSTIPFYLDSYFTKEQVARIVKEYIPAIRNLYDQTIAYGYIKEHPYIVKYINDESVLLNCVKIYGLSLEYITKQTDIICKEAIKQNSEALRYVARRYKTDENCLIAVKKHWSAIRYIIQQTPEIADSIIKQYPWALEFIINQTDEMALYCVNIDGRIIQHVHNKKEHICIAAVKQNYKALKLIPYHQTEKICLAAIKTNLDAFRYVIDYTEQIYIEAAKQSHEIFDYIPEQTLNFSYQIVNHNGLYLQHIKNKTLTICMTAVKQNPKAIEWVPPEHVEMCKKVMNPIKVEMEYIKSEDRKSVV